MAISREDIQTVETRCPACKNLHLVINEKDPEQVVCCPCGINFILRWNLTLPDTGIDKDIKKQPHYTQFKIQPMEFVQRNGIKWCAGNVIKYVCRYELKNGIEDLEKAKHYLECLIEYEKTGKITL